MSHKGSHMGKRKGGKKAPYPRPQIHTRVYEYNNNLHTWLQTRIKIPFQEEKSREKVNPSSSSSHFPFFPSPPPSFISRFIGGRGEDWWRKVFTTQVSPLLSLFSSHPCFLFSAAVWPRPASFRHSGQFQSPPPLFLTPTLYSVSTPATALWRGLIESGTGLGEVKVLEVDNTALFRSEDG